MWIDTVAHPRVHGTTGERPADRLVVEQAHLVRLPEPTTLAPYLRDTRKVARDGFVAWEGAYYGVPWQWAGQLVQVAPTATTVTVWAGADALAVHPRATQARQRLIAPGQWTGLPRGTARPTPTPLAVHQPTVEVEQRPLAAYDALLGVGA